jgi:hypothetical protein
MDRPNRTTRERHAGPHVATFPIFPCRLRRAHFDGIQSPTKNPGRSCAPWPLLHPASPYMSEGVGKSQTSDWIKYISLPIAIISRHTTSLFKKIEKNRKISIPKAWEKKNVYQRPRRKEKRKEKEWNKDSPYIQIKAYIPKRERFMIQMSTKNI